MAKNAKHEKLCEEAKEAINKVHGDTTVSRTQTLSSLGDVRDHLNLLIHGLEEDDAADDEE